MSNTACKEADRHRSITYDDFNYWIRPSSVYVLSELVSFLTFYTAIVSVRVDLPVIHKLQFCHIRMARDFNSGFNQFNPLKTKLVYILFKNLVRTSKRTPNFTITTISCLMLFKEMIAVYSKNHAKPINTKYSITDYQRRWFI
jgi:hypothetical protein